MEAAAAAGLITHAEAAMRETQNALRGSCNERGSSLSPLTLMTFGAV